MKGRKRNFLVVGDLWDALYHLGASDFCPRWSPFHVNDYHRITLGENIHVDEVSGTRERRVRRNVFVETREAIEIAVQALNFTTYTKESPHQKMW